ncbi:MAG: hypothetical protein IBX56_19910 [Methylomicrobium sp.]|nr:hypothetical protein [Methylomicrobium sp.]
MAAPEKYIFPYSTSISEKQIEVMSVIARGNPDGGYVDVYQILERVSYTESLGAVKFILRYMMAQKRVEKAGKARRERLWGEGKRGVYFRPLTVYRLTQKGMFELKSNC